MIAPACPAPGAGTARQPDPQPTNGPTGVVDAVAAGALVACVALIATLGRRLSVSIDTGGDHAVVLSAAVAGVLACDLVAGVVHWACDRFFAETTPLLGPALIASFREHHRDPLAMTRRGFLDVNGANYFAVLPFLAYAAWCDVPGGGDARELFGPTFLLALASAAIVTNQFHKWAHAPDVPVIVWCLQRVHLILPPEVHARHHHGAHRTGYCVTGGWLNPLLDRFDFFGRLERAIRACARVTAPDDRERQSS